MYLEQNFLFLNTSIEKDNPASGGERKEEGEYEGGSFPPEWFLSPCQLPRLGEKVA